jgi:plasmid maintenance system antidote protein VapI
MTPAELRKLGDKHGRGWQTRLARAVPVDVRTVRRYLSGKVVIRPVIAMRIRQVFGEWPRKSKKSEG